MKTSSGEYSEFEFANFMKIFDPSAIENRLARYGEAALTTPEAREAAELFHKHHAAYKSSLDSTKKES